MYLQKKFGFGLLAVLAGLIVSTAPLSAQQVYKATFDLPFEARWNGAILEPGNYTVTVEQGLATRLVRVRGEGGTAISAVRPSKVEPVGEPGRITFVNAGGTYVAAKFDAGSLGESFSYALPKVLKGKSARSGERTQDAVVVATH